MREAMALIRVRWLTILSYRLETAFSLFGLLVSIVPVYFISRALQPMMAKSISHEGEEYFAFIVLGLVALAFVNAATGALHGAFSADISSGTLEAMLATPISMPALIVGMLGQAFTWTALRGVMLLVGAAMFGAQIVWTKALIAAGILGLIVVAYVPLGIIAAALVLAFRTTGPWPGAVVAASMLLGGVYYPTSAIPSWLQAASQFIPLTYGLRALRRTFIDGMPLASVAGDLAILCGFAAALFVIGIALFTRGMSYARRAGNLAQY
jgi:ABC-type polysaccharide/polyol phosphate export permease